MYIFLKTMDFVNFSESANNDENKGTEIIKIRYHKVCYTSSQKVSKSNGRRGRGVSEKNAQKVLGEGGHF